MRRTVFLAPLLIIGSLVAASKPVMTVAAANPQAIVASLPRAGRAHAWLEVRRTELANMVKKNFSEARWILQARLHACRSYSVHLARTGGRIDRQKGFIVYSPETTLNLFLLDRAAIMYAAALHGETAASIPTADELFRLNGQRLGAAPVEKFPSADRVRDVLAALPIPRSALRGYRVYLLPFTMGDVSGQGGPGFTFLAAESLDERLIANQLEVTLAHEFGHYLHLAGMPQSALAGRRRWRTYLALRGLSWREDGRVNTKAWMLSPEETFAEDFRLLFGGDAASKEPAATQAGDPRRDKTLAGRIKEFMTVLAAGTKPPKDLEPWPGG